MIKVTNNPVWDGVEVRVVELRRALTDQTEKAQRYVFGVPEGRLDALRARFPKANPENLFEHALDEDQTAISEHVLSGLKRPYRFVGARCTLPSPRPDADDTTPAASAFGRKSGGLKWATGTGGFVVSGLEAIPTVSTLLIQPFARTSGTRRTHARRFAS